jgi:hypothetical protein
MFTGARPVWITPVGFEAAEVAPAVLLAVTRTRIRAPTSAAASV